MAYGESVRQRARELRRQGWTYPRIASELGVAKSSVSLWVRDVRPPPAHPARRQPRESREARARRREIERQQAKFAAAKSIGDISERDLLLAGAVAYWAEGTKDKPWRRQETLAFVNSDPDMILLFLRWVRLVGVAEGRLRFAVDIHESADIQAAEDYWRGIVGAPRSAFGKTVLKRHNPTTPRRNVATAYHGCLRVHVLDSADLYRKMHGIWKGLVLGTEHLQRIRNAQ